ncbi:YbaB/EbfC family nucleoid-associated protein, partial [Nocardia gipuzkoensis]
MTDPGTALNQLIEQAARLRDRLVRIRGRGESLGGQVRVEVDAEGDIVELTLSAELHALHLQDVATAVTDAHRQARAQARTLAPDIHRELCADPNIAVI